MRARIYLLSSFKEGWNGQLTAGKGSGLVLCVFFRMVRLYVMPEPSFDKHNRSYPSYEDGEAGDEVS